MAGALLGYHAATERFEARVVGTAGTDRLQSMLAQVGGSARYAGGGQVVLDPGRLAVSGASVRDGKAVIALSSPGLTR
ncbi:MAG: hypothetical protein JO015_12635 [Verrucomicrobia bacterium]|nr:hypothetical protein [Verrucomicrobiota bacterium]